MIRTDNILIFGDGESVLIQKRVEPLKSLPQKKVFIQNATGKKLSDNAKKYFQEFTVIEQPIIKNKSLRYLFSSFATLFFIMIYRPRLIVVHWASRLYQNIVLSLFSDRLFVTVMGGEIMSDQEGKHPQKSYYTRFLLKRAAYKTTESAYMKKIMVEEFDCKEDGILVCNFGVEESFYECKKSDRLYDKLSLPSDVKIFFSMRAMEPFYETHIIVSRFIEFKVATGSDAILVVTANRSSKEYLELIANMIASSGLKDSVKIVSDIAHEDIADYVAISDAIVSMAPSDGLPHTMLECLAAKKFMIFRNLPQYDGFLEHKKSAFLVNSDSELLDAFVFVENSKDLSYEADEETLALINKKSLAAQYLAICDKIISSGGK